MPASDNEVHYEFDQRCAAWVVVDTCTHLAGRLCRRSVNEIDARSALRTRRVSETTALARSMRNAATNGTVSISTVRTTRQGLSTLDTNVNCL